MSVRTRYRWRRLVLSAQIARQEARIAFLKSGLRFSTRPRQIALPEREKSFLEEFFGFLLLLAVLWLCIAAAMLF